MLLFWIWDLIKGNEHNAHTKKSELLWYLESGFVN